MTKLLIKLFVKDSRNVSDPAVRQRYAMLAGVTGIVLNLLLFAGKLTTGILAASVAVIADAFNNVSDAGSSVITIIGFRLAGNTRTRNTRWATAGWNMSALSSSIC